MAYMNWDNSFSVGVEEIDAQHKNLINIFNKFYYRIESDDKKALGRLLASLVEYTVYHFATEEKYMKKFNYPDAENHIKEHQLFTEKVADVKKRFDSGMLIPLSTTDF